MECRRMCGYASWLEEEPTTEAHFCFWTCQTLGMTFLFVIRSSRRKGAFV